MATGLTEKKADQKSKQITGNAGLYYVCYELAKRGWNVMPTTRNARGVDVIIYNDNAKKKYAIQVKTLSKRNSLAFGKSLEHLRMNDYLMVCTNVYDNPRIFICKFHQIENEIDPLTNQKGETNHFLHYQVYERYEDNWRIIK